MGLFTRRTKNREEAERRLEAALVQTAQDLFPGLSDLWNVSGVDTHPALMIPASLAAVSFVTKTLVGSDPVYEERLTSGKWKAVDDIEKIPKFLRAEDYHPNGIQTYDDLIGDLVVSIMISHGGYVVSLGSPGDFPDQVQTLPSWAAIMSRSVSVDPAKYQLRIGSVLNQYGRVIREGRVLDRYSPGVEGNYLYLSMLRWGSIPYGVDTVSTNRRTFLKHLSAIETSRRFAKNPLPSMVVEVDTDAEGSYQGDTSSLKRLKEQFASIGQDPDNPAVATTEVIIRKIHALRQSVGDIGLHEILMRSAADMGTIHGVMDTFLAAGKASSWGTVVRDLDRVVQSHTINPLKVKIQRAFSLMSLPGFRVRIVDEQLRPETKKERSDRLGSLVDDGIYSPNEARLELGKEPDSESESDRLRIPRARRRVDVEGRGRPEQYDVDDEDIE